MAIRSDWPAYYSHTRVNLVSDTFQILVRLERNNRVVPITFNRQTAGELLKRLQEYIGE